MTGKRRSLAELAGSAITAVATDDHSTATSAAGTGNDTGTAGQAAKRPSRRRPAKPARPARWDELERKETRLRADQYEALTNLSRALNRQRSGGQRITENTLIRGAIDILLERKAQLTGSNEEELRKSVTN